MVLRSERWDSKSRYVEMPPSHESFGLADSSIPMRLESEYISDILFVRTPPIFNEYLWAFSLRIRLRSSSVEDLRELFFTAENHLGCKAPAHLESDSKLRMVWSRQ